MAIRKQFLSNLDENKKLSDLLRGLEGREITDEELDEQRVSFAFGNALGNSSITKDSVRYASKRIRVRG